MLSVISITIYLYIFICLAFLLFNIIYIVSSKSSVFFHKIKKLRFSQVVEIECYRVTKEKKGLTEHHKFLIRNLGSINNLIAYDAAIEELLGEEVPLQPYFDAYSEAFQGLVHFYRNKPAMYRAYVASLMAEYKPLAGNNSRLCELILTYFNNSSTYCRENILKALYALGHPSSILHAFMLMSEHNYPHARYLIADGLMNYTGDKIELAWLLWNNAKSFKDTFQVAIVQFASMLSGEFAESFLLALKKTNTPAETRFVLIRYFGKWYYPPAEECLVGFLKEENLDHDSFAIVAATSLSNYRSDKARFALIEAIHSKNYFIRKNAASSLVRIGITEKEKEEIYGSGDKYAIQMLDFTLNQ